MINTITAHPLNTQNCCVFKLHDSYSESEFDIKAAYLDLQTRRLQFSGGTRRYPVSREQRDHQNLELGCGFDSM